MINYPEKYCHMLDELNFKYFLSDNKIWILDSQRVRPLGPALIDYSISDVDAKKIMNQLNGKFIYWTSGFKNVLEKSNWYAVILDKFTPVEEIKSENTRSKIRRGLKNSEVKKIDADEMIKNGYDVYEEANKKYKSKKIIERRKFNSRFEVTKKYEDLVDYWGVFHKNKLVAYTEVLKYDNIEANYSAIKFSPDFMKYYTSYAMIYKMNEHYLRDKNFSYVNDGFRSIYHKTSIQEYLIDKFSFEKKKTNLFVQYNFSINAILKITKSLKFLHSILDNRIKALIELDKLRIK
ncbi:MAG: hypothetical protein C0425_08970 [Chlorobiaceae bacterium]|nr:hypothetical protein [Chlorobiaceae bacterium]MBA4310454.1 hypothetical protein [Chlorobiaceae bacterium]